MAVIYDYFLFFTKTTVEFFIINMLPTFFKLLKQCFVLDFIKISYRPHQFREFL
jgi:hypothetical protein